MTGAYQVVIEFSLASAFHTIAAFRILTIFWKMIRYHLKGSEFLVALLVNWFVTCVLIVPYELFGVFSWRVNDDGNRNGYLLFALGLPPHVFGLGLLPVSVFFLTMERICIIVLKLGYGRTQRRALFIAYMGTLLLGVLVVSFGFYEAFQKLQPVMPCVINGCILGPYVRIYLGWRAVCAVMNFTSGVVFFTLFYRSRRSFADKQCQIKQTNRSNNLMTLLAIVTEFFLAFIPHFFPFVWEQIFGPGSSMWTGPLSEIASSIEVTIFTVTYSRLFRRQLANSTPGVIPIATATNNHQRNGNIQGKNGAQNISPEAYNNGKKRHTIQNLALTDYELKRLRRLRDQQEQGEDRRRPSLLPSSSEHQQKEQLQKKAWTRDGGILVVTKY